MFWVAIQDHTKVGGLADRVNVKIDFNSFYYKSEFSNLITIVYIYFIIILVMIITVPHIMLNMLKYMEQKQLKY
jgi:hypothetical protein